ncbi:MAG: ABC transporter permease [Alphaproteobacteria bacterium]|nr:ABC transporter permease [Alphaproteobacteria bacterium]
MRTALRLLGGQRFLVAPLCLLGAVIVFAASAPEFLTLGNVSNVGAQMWVLALLAVGQMFAIVTRGFDISVGAVAALSSTIAAHAVNALGPAGLLAGPLTGLLCGTLTGFLIGFLRLQPIVATLGMMIGVRGLALLVTGDGQVVPLHDADLASWLAFDPAFGLPPADWGAIGCILLAGALLGRAVLGRRLVMLGSNPDAAHLVGIDTARTQLRAYQLCGGFAGLAGVLVLLRAGTGLPTDGAGMELQSIAAALIGGTALSGGVARVFPVVLGAAFIQAVLTGLDLQGVSPFIAQIVVGLVIVAAGFLEFALRRFQGFAFHRRSWT